MKCPHCQKEIPNYAQTREYCKEESSANQLQTTNNSSPGTLELPGQASLLATLPDKELQWAYYASIFLRLFGLLLYVIAIIPVFVVGMIGIIDGCMSLWQDFIWSCLIPFSCSIVLYAIGYVMRNIRTKTTRIILQGLALLSLASYSYACYELFKEEPLAYYIPMIVLLTFCGWLWRLNRKMKLLFGENAPSHEQIAYAWSCRKRHLDLDAASLPAPRHPGRLDKTFVVASWLWLPLVVLAIVETTFPSLWKKNAMEELAIQATANTQPDHDAQVQPKKTLEEIRGEEITWDDLSAIVYRETGIFGPTEEFFLSLEDPAVVHAFGSGGGFGCIGMVYLSDEDMHSLINSILPSLTMIEK